MGRAKDWSLKILGLVSLVRFLVAPRKESRSSE